MLRIRDEQMRALGEYMRQAFEQRTVDALRACDPGKWTALGPEAVLDLVRLGIERAAAYGIRAEHDVERYIVLMFRLDPDFDEGFPPAAETLANPDLSPRMKVDRLWQAAQAVAAEGSRLGAP